MADFHKKIVAEFELIIETLKELEKTFVRPEQTVIELMAIAGFISNVYHGIENVLKLTLKSQKTNIPPDSATSHKDLLFIAREHHIINENLFENLDEYRAFRHFFIHAYGLNLDPQQLNPLAKRLPKICQSFRTTITKILNEQR